MRDQFSAVAGHEQHLDPRPQDRQLVGDFFAVHARHDHIGQQQIDRPHMLRHLPQRLRPVGGLQNLKTAQLERPHDQAANAFVVLHHEDGFGTSYAPPADSSPPRVGGPRIDARKIDRKVAPLPGSLCTSMYPSFCLTMP